MSPITPGQERDDTEDRAQERRNVKVFISYAHEDRELHKKLVEHLSPLKYLGITIFHDQEIVPGMDWKNQIDTQLNEADIILLLVSPSFIASEYCWNEEVQTAFERHKAGEVRVIPIILKPVVWQTTPLKVLQALPTDALAVTEWHNQDAAFENVVRGIMKAADSLESTRKVNPLQRFATALRNVFQEVTRKDQMDSPLSRRLLLIGCILLVVYCLDVSLSLFNIPFPTWVSFLALCLALLCALLLFREVLWTAMSREAKERRAFLALSAATLGLLTVGNFLERKGQLTRLRIGLIGTDLGPSQTRPFEDAASELLNVPVSSIFKSTYTDEVNALGQGGLEVAWLGPFSYLRARQQCHAKTIVCNTNLKGEAIYRSYIIANARAGIHNLNNLKGKSFAIPDEYSTSGKLIPFYELKQAGLNPFTDIQTAYVGPHNVLSNVLSGTYPAGAISSDDYDASLGEGKFRQGDLVILKVSDPIPQGPFAVRNDIRDYDVLRIEDAFFTIQERDSSILHTLGIGGFAKIEDNSYDFLLNYANDLGLDPSKFA